MAKRFQQGALVTEASPVGTVKAYAGSSIPSGWLLCNGDPYSRTTYAALFALIGTTYDTQTNETTGSPFAAPAGTDFRVPDYRGLFLRGVGSPSGLDAVTLGGRQTTKTKVPVTAFTTASQSLSGGSAAGSQIGLGDSSQIMVLNGGSLTGGLYQFGGSPFRYQDATSTSHSHTVTGTCPASTVNGGGDNETRPLNKGVNYIIKF